MKLNRPSLSSNHGKIGCFTKLALAIVGLIGFFFIRGQLSEWREGRHEVRRLENLAEAEHELRSFAGDHLPELQRVITDFEDEIARRETMLDALHKDMRRLNRDPNKDPDIRRWKEAIEKMHQELRQLYENRADAYLAFRKFELNPESLDDAEARTRRFERARSAATEGRKTFERLLREAEPIQ